MPLSHRLLKRRRRNDNPIHYRIPYSATDHAANLAAYPGAERTARIPRSADRAANTAPPTAYGTNPCPRDVCKREARPAGRRAAQHTTA